MLDGVDGLQHCVCNLHVRRMEGDFGEGRSCCGDGVCQTGVVSKIDGGASFSTSSRKGTKVLASERSEERRVGKECPV